MSYIRTRGMAQASISGVNTASTVGLTLEGEKLWRTVRSVSGASCGGTASIEGLAKEHAEDKPTKVPS